MKSISRLLIILACSGLAGLPQAAWSQAAGNNRPTARYARGENVDLALIIAEWRKPYPNVPIYTCICQTETCNETERWPFRTFERYQSIVALGPYNGSYTETRGFRCFNIETGERPQSTP